jgi:flavin-dependent dehydrogenase
MLLDAAAAAGARLVRASLGRARRARRAGAGFELDLDAAPAMEASFVIDATGRRARVASALGARRILFDRLVTAVVFFDAGDDVSADTRTLVEAVEDGWWYAARIPGGGAIAAFSTDGDIARRLHLRDERAFHRALAATRHTRARLAGARARAAPSLHPADSSALDAVSGDGWAAVGDAALAFDPLSGQGLVKALHHGLCAAYAASDHVAGRPGASARFSTQLGGEIEGYLEARERCYRDEARFAGALFWRRRRPEIHLSPAAVLSTRAPAAARALPMHLAREDLVRLAALAGDGRPAHEVVAAARRAGVVACDRRLVLALQYLVEVGVIAAHAAPPAAAHAAPPAAAHAAPPASPATLGANP